MPWHVRLSAPGGSLSFGGPCLPLSHGTPPPNSLELPTAPPLGKTPLAPPKPLALCPPPRRPQEVPPETDAEASPPALRLLYAQAMEEMFVKCVDEEEAAFRAIVEAAGIAWGDWMALVGVWALAAAAGIGGGGGMHSKGRGLRGGLSSG